MNPFIKDLWSLFDDFRKDSKLKPSQYCMPVLGIIFLKCVYLRFKDAETKINRNRLVRNGKEEPIDEHDFIKMGAIKLPQQAQFKWILSLSSQTGDDLNKAMSLIEEQSEQLNGLLYKSYNELPDEEIKKLLDIFASEDVDNCIGETYEYFLENFEIESANQEEAIFTNKLLAKIIVNILAPERGIVLDPFCGTGRNFVQIKKYMGKQNLDCNKLINFYAHEKDVYNAHLCMMNNIINNLNVKFAYGNEGNTYYYDPFNLNGKCDYILAKSRFNSDEINVSEVLAAGRLPFDLPKANKSKIANINLLWISYCYSYLNERGKAGFVMPYNAFEGADDEFKNKVVETKHVDLIINIPSVSSSSKEGCSLWFFNRQKLSEYENKILFIDVSEYFTDIEGEQNDWKIKNLNAVISLYRGQSEKYTDLIKEYRRELKALAIDLSINVENDDYLKQFKDEKEELIKGIEDFIGKAKKSIERDLDRLEKGILIAAEYEWLHSKFREGKYKNILRFCKAVDLEEVRENNYSLNPWIYVDVEQKEKKDKEVVINRIESMHRDLAELQKESNEIMARIQENMKLWKK